MRNAIQAGNNLTIPAPNDVASGDGVLVGALFGVAAETAKAGDDLDIVVVGVFRLPKVAAQAIVLGDALFFDNATKLVTKTATGNTRIGIATEIAANPSSTVAVRLNGSF